MALLSSYANNKVYLESGIITLFLKKQENNMNNKLSFFVAILFYVCHTVV